MSPTPKHEITISAREVSEQLKRDAQIKIKIQGMGKLRARIKLGTWLMLLGAWVIGVPCEIEKTTEQDRRT